MRLLRKDVLFIVPLLFCHTQGTVWNAEDALILETDGEIQESNVNGGLETTTVIVEDEEGACITNEGVSGVCIRFTECYPYFNNAVKDTHQTTVAEHIDLIKNISTPCQPVIEEKTINPLAPGGEGVNEYDHICCATLARVTKYNNFPFFPSLINPAQPPQEPQAPEKEAEGDSTKASGCGVTPYSSSISHVVKGREAKKGEFPWAVALFQNGRHHCGASLIDSKHVLTAAHCVNNIRTGPMLQNVRLYIGAHDIYSGRDYEVRKVKKLAFHKGFDGTQFRDDIALMVLEQPVTFSSKIKPICLATAGFPNYDTGATDADIAGWGKTSEHGPPSKTLRTAQIRIWTNPQCSQKYRGTLAPAIASGMLCAGTNGVDSCQGDSGGPLTLKQSGRETLIGIVSWGIKCGVYPGVYTRVDQYTPWIEKYKAKLS